MRIYIIAIVLIAVSCTSTNTSQPIATQPAPTPTSDMIPNQDLIDKIIKFQDGITSVPIAVTRPIEGGGSQALITVITTPDYNNEDTAIGIFALALEELVEYSVSSPIYFSLIIDDGTVKTAYEHNRETQSFDIKNLD